MNSVKVQNFRRENPGSEFPPFTALSPVTCAKLRGAIATRLGLHAQSEPLIVLEALRAKAKCIAGVDAENGFDLQEVIVEQDCQPRPYVLINWNRFDDMDRIAFLDLSKHFGDIWYPSSDDIEIFDESLSWFVLIRHDGQVSAVNLSLPSR